MFAKAIKTPRVRVGDNLNHIIATSIPQVPENSVLVIASKIFSFAENRLVKKRTRTKAEKWALAKQEADWWLDPNASKYQCMLTIKGNWMFANAGIDESNAEKGFFALWPEDPQASVNAVWRFLREHYGVAHVGVIMSDSRSSPLSWGVIGHGIAHCGFEALRSYIGQPDLHGRPMEMEQVNMVQSVVAVGTLVMGEGNEGTPIGLVTDIPGIVFQDHEPTEAELKHLQIDKEDDIYAPLLTSVAWNKGGAK